MEYLPHEKQIVEYEKTLKQFREQNQKNPLFSAEELRKLEKKLDKLKAKVYSTLNAWERVQICRHPSRPRSIDYIKNLCSDFFELHGDRTFKDDHAIIGGFATIEERKFVVIGQEKGCDTESRLYRNFGMMHPEGFRKALRLAYLADKFHLPVLFFIDTPGAYAGLTAEERGQGAAIALNLRELFQISTPLIVVIIGEGCSGGALGIGIGDSIGMLEHSYYSVISPEACASILWKDPSKNIIAAESMNMQSENLLEYEIIDAIIKEPLGGAHHDPEKTYQNVKTFILEQWEVLRRYPPEILLERRYRKFRKIGRFSIHEATVESGST